MMIIKTGIGSYKNRDEILSLRDSALEPGKSVQLDNIGYLSAYRKLKYR